MRHMGGGGKRGLWEFLKKNIKLIEELSGWDQKSAQKMFHDLRKCCSF